MCCFTGKKQEGGEVRRGTNIPEMSKLRPFHNCEKEVCTIRVLNPCAASVERQPAAQQHSSGSAGHFPSALVGDAQFLPVLIYGPPGDLDPALREGGADLFIA